MCETDCHGCHPARAVRGNPLRTEVGRGLTGERPGVLRGGGIGVQAATTMEGLELRQSRAGAVAEVAQLAMLVCRPGGPFTSRGSSGTQGRSRPPVARKRAGERLGFPEDGSAEVVGGSQC